jgi:hypothetical protein
LPLVGATLAVGTLSALPVPASVCSLRQRSDVQDGHCRCHGSTTLRAPPTTRRKLLGDTKAATKAQNDMAASLNVLTPTQRAAAKEVISLNTAFSADLSKSTAPTVLGIITNAGTTLAKIIPKITPAVTAMGTALSGKISSTALTGLSKSVTPITNLITSQGIPAIKSTGDDRRQSAADSRSSRDGVRAARNVDPEQARAADVRTQVDQLRFAR